MYGYLCKRSVLFYELSIKTNAAINIKIDACIINHNS